MAQFDPRVAQAYNEAIAAGLSEAEAERVAGITDANAYFYEVSIDGSLQEAVVGPGLRPNETIVPAGQSIDDGDDDEPTVRNTLINDSISSSIRSRLTPPSTIITQDTQITGGGSTTRTVVPTQYEDNASSRAIQAEANDLEAQKQARRNAIRDAGGTGADVLRDPEFRRLSDEQAAKEYEVEQARTRVPDTGGVITAVTPGTDQTITTQTVDGEFATNRSSGFDPQSQAIEADAGSPPARNFSAQDVTADDVAAVRPIEDDIEGGAVGFPEGTFAGDGYGFTYDENGELIPADSADAERIRSTPADTEDEFAGDGYGFVYDENGELIPADSAAAAQVENSAPEPVGGTFTEVFDEETGTWGVINADTGETVASGLTEQAAILEAENRSAGDPSYGSPAAEPEPDADEGEGGAGGGVIAEVKARQSIREQLGLGANGANRGDWRVRLSLAPGSNYLYNSTDPGILRPLANTQGVIFPYTPTIATTYSANYEQYDLTHSNFRGYFYRNSNVGEITITATFTAQDTREAEYLLAVIHFFRSATKMFYGGGNGQPDEYLGSPPPLVYLTGYGDYQFSGHPCVISQFGYNLPGDVDYIRAFSKNINGTSMASRADQQSVPPTVPSLGSAVLSRLTAIGLGAPGSGGQSSRQPSSPSDFRPGDLGLGGGADNPTYVPTKIDISLTLLPMQSRQRISQEFSLRDFATGKLLRGGMW